jgi:hypothetical protein
MSFHQIPPGFLGISKGFSFYEDGIRAVKEKWRSCGVLFQTDGGGKIRSGEMRDCKAIQGEERRASGG